MGQEPNIEVDLSDLPRQEPEPAAPARWKPSRPGEIGAPGEVQWGGAFGRPGPDTGWAMKLVRLAAFERGAHADEVEKIVATVAGARAGRFGRAPVPDDVEVALTLLGLRPDGLPATVAELERHRRRWIAVAAHEKVKGKAFLASIPEELLAATPQELRALPALQQILQGR